MTDYAEERSSELEVLESIFPDELTVISEDKLSIRVEQDPPHPTDPYTLLLTITYSPTYPDELPEIGIETLEGELSEDEEEELVMGLIAAANDSLGMAMVYTLSLHLRETLGELLDARKVRHAKELAERERIIEEATAIKTAGTKVTPASFEAWRIKFEAEMKEKAKKDEQDRIRALPPKEREETKKFLAKYTGRQQFEKDLQGNLVRSDADELYDEEGAVSVDASQYERADHLSDDEEEEERHLGALSDDD